jgi:hypothetical protein
MPALIARQANSNLLHTLLVNAIAHCWPPWNTAYMHITWQHVMSIAGRRELIQRWGMGWLCWAVSTNEGSSGPCSVWVMLVSAVPCRCGFNTHLPDFITSSTR